MAESSYAETAFAATISAAPPNSHAQKMDGWLYVGLGMAALAGSVIARLAGTSPEAISFLGVGLSAATVLCGFGLFKLALAMHRAQPTFLGYATVAAISIYMLGVYSALCVYVLPHMVARHFHTEPMVWSWFLPACVISALLLAWSWRANGERLLIRRAACFIIISWLLLVSTAGAIATEAFVWARNGSYYNYYFYNRHEYSIWFPSSEVCRTIGAISIACSIAFFALTLRGLRRIQLKRMDSLASGSVLLFSWLYLVPLLNLLLFFAVQSWVAFVGFASAAGSVALAGIFGAIVARTWRRERSRLRFWIATTPMALLLLTFLPITMGTLSALNKRNYNWPNFQKEWMWYAPEPVRTMTTRMLVEIMPKYRMAVYRMGLPSAEMLASECLGPRSETIEWPAWGSRDRAGCLAAALAVPATVGSGSIPVFNYDFSAGMAVGMYADDAEFVKRLTGNWSYRYVGGLIRGIDTERAVRFRKEIASVFKTRTMEPQCWYWYSMKDNAAYQSTLVDMLENPGSADPAHILDCLQPCNSQLESELMLAALKSPDPAIRIFALEAENQGFRAIEYWTDDVRSEFMTCAMGTRPGSTPDERRKAANRLARKDATEFHFIPFGVVLNTPLSPEDIKKIDAICEQTRESLRQHSGK